MNIRPCHAAVLATLVAASPLCADITMPSVFSDHMVLQRDLPLEIWGTAEPGSRIRVNLISSQPKGVKGQVFDLQAGPDGRWQTRMNAISETEHTWRLEVIEKSGEGPYSKAKVLSSLAFEDVLIGEVWLCGGQSNMEWVMNSVGTTPEQKAGMNHPTIRLIKAPHVLATEPQDDIDAEWQVCTPKTVGNWSAVGLYFGLALQSELDVPIGLISSNWGGTRIEPWIERADLAAHPRFAKRTMKLQAGIDDYNSMDDATRRRKVEQANRGFNEKAEGYWQEILATDPGAKNQWMKPDLNDSGWGEMKLPGNWEQREDSLKNFDGTVWFRRDIKIPADWKNSPLIIELGRIDDSDRTWFDGNLVGTTTNKHTGARRYKVKSKMVDAGKANITVCALDPHGGGGFSGGAMKLMRADGQGPVIELAGDWKWKRGVATTNSGPNRVTEPINPGMTPQSAGTLHAAMIAPFVPYTLRGAIWYQGESNAGEPDEYRDLMPLLIESWREDFGDHLAFGIVQLAAYKAVSQNPDEGDWAYLRDAQLEAARTVENTGIAITTDVGNATDIHPKNKKAVGDRLAGWALHDVYHRENAIPSSPIYRSAQTEGGMMMLSFDHAQGGLRSSDGGKKIDGFAIAGPDGSFVWADAMVTGPETVQVWSNEVPDPRIVRYAWQNNPVRANLVGGTGLPASPFRTDQPASKQAGSR
ncbi:MAG: sialate O-acetylesterase [Phycisphaerales bacterium]|nr:sialate O-acetylesterase [Phycisphaerales bacterium]